MSKELITLSVIIPCYNEEEAIEENAKIVHDKLESLMANGKIKDYEIILVDDGSKDSTSVKLASIKNNLSKVIAVLNPENHGKGYAVKSGFKAASMDRLLFMDADLSTDVRYIDDFLMYANLADILIASRAKYRDKNNEGRPFVRKVMSFGCTVCVQNLLPEMKDIEDFQCGFKMFTKETAELCLKHSTLDRYAFDTEFLYVCRLNKYVIREVPVLWHDTRTGRIKARKDSTDFFKCLLDIRNNRESYIED